MIRLDSLAGKRVLVTGGARGIGLAAAKLFLAQGAQVAIWALHQESIDGALPGLEEASGGQVIGQALDIGQRPAVEAAVADLLDQWQGLDVLVNNAGYTLTSRFLEEDQAYWERVVATNLWGVIYTTRAVLEWMRTQGGGAVVNVVSDAGRVGMAGEAVYAASKAGVVGLSKSLAQEMARHHIRLNCVSPGPTRTRILEMNSEEDDAQKLIDKMIRRIPLREIAEPGDVASVIAFLASDEASHITGQTVSISGGLTMV